MRTSQNRHMGAIERPWIPRARPLECNKTWFRYPMYARSTPAQAPIAEGRIVPRIRSQKAALCRAPWQQTWSTPPRPLASRRVDSLAFELTLIGYINQNPYPPCPPKGRGGVIFSRVFPTRRPLSCQLSKVFCSNSCACSPPVNADSTMVASSQRCFAPARVVLGVGSAFRVDQHGPADREASTFSRMHTPHWPK